MAGILIVDDEINAIKCFEMLLSGEHHVYGALNGSAAMKYLLSNEIDIVFLDFNLAGENGLDILKEMKALKPDLHIIMISGLGDCDVIIKAMSLGAFDYLEKPLDIERINSLVRRILEAGKLTNIVSLIDEDKRHGVDSGRIVGKSAAMREIFKQIGLLLNRNISVLITGDNGTGKELIARALHFGSHRREEPFVAINCSGLSESLLDNELFGHEKQAFTGADSMTPGKFETAGEGTLFLDEIGEMPLSLQVKFLRVLQEREFHRLGGHRSLKLRARIITATNINIDEEVEAGQFRRDLFYRINVSRIDVPPLSDRKEDIPLLLDHFINETNRKIDKRIEGVSGKVIETLLAYDWPGNVRQLENAVLNMCLNTHGAVITESSVPEYVIKEKTASESSRSLDDYLTDFLSGRDRYENLLPGIHDQVEMKLIEMLRRKFGNNKTRIADALGISRVTLAKKMQKAEV